MWKNVKIINLLKKFFLLFYESSIITKLDTNGPQNSHSLFFESHIDG